MQQISMLCLVAVLLASLYCASCLTMDEATQRRLNAELMTVIGNSHMSDNDQSRAIRTLVDRRADVNTHEGNEERITALMYAIQCKRILSFCELLAHGANILLKDTRLCSVLHYAAYAGDERFVECILRRLDSSTQTRLIDINGTNVDGGTPLMLACCHGQDHDRAIETLIRSGADIDIVFEGFFKSALYQVLLNRDLPIHKLVQLAKKLIGCGARVDTINDALSRSSNTRDASDPCALEILVYEERIKYLHDRRNGVWARLLLRSLFRDGHDEVSRKRSIAEVVSAYVSNAPCPTSIPMIISNIIPFDRVLLGAPIDSAWTNAEASPLQLACAYDAAHFGDPLHSPQEIRLLKARIDHLKEYGLGRNRARGILNLSRNNVPSLANTRSARPWHEERWI